MKKKRTIAKKPNQGHTEKSQQMDQSSSARVVLDPDLVINPSEALNSPEKVAAFWNRYAERIQGRLRKLEKQQSESVRWARETLIR